MAVVHSATTTTTTDIDGVAAHLKQLLAEGRNDDVLELVIGLLTQLRDQNNALQLRLMKLLRQQFGRKSERINSEQLSLLLGQLAERRVDVTPAAEAPAATEDAAPEAELPRPQPASKKKGHGRRPVPADLPREVRVHEPPQADRTCSTCGQEKARIGEECGETLEFVPASFKVIRDVRPKYACRPCGDGVVIGAVPDKVIPSGLSGPGLLAHVLVSKYKDAIPLSRLREMYRRSGVDLPVSTLGDWVKAGADALLPLARLVERKALASHVLQADDTGIRVLDRDHRNGAKRGHVWLYLGDGRWAAFRYTPTWSGEGPQRFLAGRVGWLQVDGYKGFQKVFTSEAATAIEVGCWSHARRGFVDCLEAGDLRAAHAVDLIGKLFAIERQADADAVTPEERRRRRRAESEPILNELGQWMAETYNHEPPKSPLAKAISYSVSRWKALSRFLEDGALPLHNNACERGLRAIAIGRKNYLFAGSDAAAERAATIYTVVATATLNGLDPWAYLKDVLEKLAGGWPQRRIEELLPPAWTPAAG